MKYLFLIFSITLSSFAVIAQQKVLLHENWQFHMEGATEKHPAVVPGTVHQDLMRAEVIEDIYFENNEHKYQWIENKNWIYQSQFQVDQQNLDSDHQALVFEGLDTYAEVYLNDSLVLTADNMFRTWSVEVKNILRLGLNDIHIKFHSPIEKNKAKFKNAPYTLPAGCETVDIKVSPYTRKAAYHFGWDWGPRVVSCGIWKPVYLEFWNKAKIKNLWANTISANAAMAKVKFMFEVDFDPATLKDLSAKLNGSACKLEYDSARKSFEHLVEISKPKLWWPRSHGTPHLSDFKLELFYKNQLIDEQKLRVGIRTVELVHEADSIGTAFYFKVNGQAIFAKGANYIPQDLLVPRVSEAQYEKLLAQVEEANMNMIRVWGGGIYERDIFYELCDEKGILVWQDFMFAGSMYPNDPTFLDNVKAEVVDNVKRLRHHPSIAIWCGNNEMEVAWHNWGWQKQYNYSAQDSSEIWQNYLKIFKDIIPTQLSQLDPTRAYTSTSPLSNWGTAENFNHASMHYWGVWHGREAFENFKTNVGRFMVEYGFQSFPELESLKKVLADTSLDLNSVAMKNRQKSYIGNGLITKHIERNFRAPTSFEDFVELSQLTQALGMKIAIQEHRKAQPHCMGTLFWQLNDCWPGPSWSVIDYYGNPKKAFYEVKNNYQKIIVATESKNEKFLAHLVSNHQNDFSGQLEVFAYDTTGATKWKKKYPVRLSAHAKQMMNLKKVYKRLEKCKEKNYSYKLRLTDQNKETVFEDQFTY